MVPCANGTTSSTSRSGSRRLTIIAIPSAHSVSSAGSTKGSPVACRHRRTPYASRNAAMTPATCQRIADVTAARSRTTNRGFNEAICADVKRPSRSGSVPPRRSLISRRRVCRVVRPVVVRIRRASTVMRDSAPTLGNIRREVGPVPPPDTKSTTSRATNSRSRGSPKTTSCGASASAVARVLRSTAVPDASRALVSSIEAFAAAPTIHMAPTSSSDAAASRISSRSSVGPERRCRAWARDSGVE